MGTGAPDVWASQSCAVIIIIIIVVHFSFAFQEEEGDTSGEPLSVHTGAALEAILQRLPTCVNKDFIDEVSHNVC